jgi:hypothetical protein
VLTLKADIKIPEGVAIMKRSNPIEQFQSNPLSRAYAIRAKCAECVGCTPDHLERGFKDSISSCSSESCPLHRFRPYQREKSLEDQKLPIQNLSNDYPCHESI